MEIKKELTSKRNLILQLASEHGARNIRIFGSVARGEEKPTSDVDFLVEMDQGRSLLDHVGFIQDLETLLGRHVDVVTERALHWYIRDRVLSEAIPL